MSTANPLPNGARERLQTWIDNPQVAAFLQASNWKEAFANYTYLEIPDPPPFVPPGKPLSEATIAVLTSGGLYLEGEQEPFAAADVYGDPSIRLLPIDTPYERLRIAHDHYDHTVPMQDLNTINPVRHLKALQDEGSIGAVYPQQISFSGYIPVWTRTLEHLVPSVLNEVIGKPIDGILLVPV
jgi:D-proline reductase (dithiol) PrdB